MRAALARLVATGSIREALSLIASSRTAAHDERAIECEFEDVAGRPERSYELAAQLIASATASAPQARALCVSGRIDLRVGRFAEGLAKFAKANQIAIADGDHELIATVQGRRIEALLTYVSLESATPYLAEFRRAALRGASSSTLLELHSLLANVEFKCGRPLRALHELNLAAAHIIEPVDNFRLSQLEQAFSIVLGYLGHTEDAAKRAHAAADIAKSIGATRVAAASFNNLAHLSILMLDEPSTRRALANAHTLDRDLLRAATELDAAMAFGDVEGANTISTAFAAAALADQSMRSLWFLLTNCCFHTLTGQADKAVQFGEVGLERALRLAERGMATRFRYQLARAYALLGKRREAVTLIESELRNPAPMQPEAFADFERSLGALTRSEPNVAAEHLTRSSRVYGYTRNRFCARLAKDDLSTLEPLSSPSATDTESLAVTWNAPEAESSGFRLAVDVPAGRERSAIRRALRSMAAIVELWPNTLIAGEELLAFVADSGCASSIRLVRSKDGRAQTLAAAGLPSRREDATQTVEISLGTVNQAEISIKVEPLDDPSSYVTLLSLRRLLRHAAEVHETAIRESKSSALWPEPPREQQLGFISAAESMLELLTVARRLAPSTIPILITGETGTGKELLARALHFSSPRAGKRFLPYNCTAVPRDMLDSQLFGYRRGAFTGAQDAFPGVIRSAAGGTLFLDEIGEISPEVQPKLLRFLESSEVHPLGEAAPVPVDVRIVAATNANLEALVAEGRFREDLFYRLNVVKLTIPPLRERREEIPLLLEHFLERSQRESSKTGVRFSDIAIEYLLLYNWPGNVRELANEVRRAVALAESGAVLMPEHLSPRIAASRRTVPAGQRPPTPSELIVRRDQPLSAAIEHVERAMIQDALRRHANVEDAAKALGLSRKGLYLKRQRLKIDDAFMAS